MVPSLSIGLVPRAHGELPFVLDAVPPAAQEGNTVSLVLSANNAVPNLQYSFRFSVTDPAGRTAQSGALNYTTASGQSSFTMTVLYPSPSLQGSNTLAGQYSAKVDELWPTAAPSVAGTMFTLSITNSMSYQRTQTIIVQASGYNASESVSITMRNQATSNIVFSQNVVASSIGIVSTSWKIPKNVTLGNYQVSLTGTTTVKSTPDAQQVAVTQAIMTIGAVSSDKPLHQRTEIMRFSFQPVYPDGSTASTGVGLLTLSSPTGTTVTLTATYQSASQTFNATYTTLLTNTTGSWTASLSGHAYTDAYGNSGPGGVVATIPQLAPATLNINLNTNTVVGVGQALRLNASITYPDGTVFQSGTVKANLVYSGTPAINNTIPLVFDTALKLWFGTYTVRPQDTGGFWSLTVTASDSPTPPNSGSATRAITVQNTSGGGTPTSSTPLYYFGIIAALLAALLASIFLMFKRRKVTQARLKIDLDAVKSEAGRIESSDFFRSVKDQVKKDKPEN